ncbi:hypothetical protein BJY04DRAFT_136696 [Aspergillus karnatakaensis]|uniref:uncharacterized protein n=1 Tax=Aspergillus karnatakaensis TaxID=1810916 RepID=UPI003CCCA3EF
MVLNQAPPAVQGMSTAPIDISTFLKPALGPSDILSRALLRHTSKNNDTLYASTIVELQNILDFILLAEHASFADMYALYTHASERRTADTTDISLPKDTTKTTRAINQAANIAINIFWTVFYNYLYPDPEPESGLFSPTSPQTSSSVEEANSDTKQSREQPLIESLHIVLQKIDILSWQHLAPEIYVWVSLTAAAACRTSEERIPFITALTPLLSAEDSAELELSGMGWVYFQWVGGFVC